MNLEQYMSYFFRLENSKNTSSLQIPLFTNRGKILKNLALLCAWPYQNLWHYSIIEKQGDELFFVIDKPVHSNDEIYFFFDKNKLPSKKFSLEILLQPDKITKTSPEFRANLSIQDSRKNKSSYQSEYPYGMTQRRGRVHSPIDMLATVDTDSLIFFRNIHHEPNQSEVKAGLIKPKDFSLVRQFKVKSNCTNVIELNSEEISQGYYFVVDGLLGIPIYCNRSPSGISLEHTHPPHSTLFGPNAQKKLSKFRKELFNVFG